MIAMPITSISSASTMITKSRSVRVRSGLRSRNMPNSTNPATSNSIITPNETASFLSDGSFLLLLIFELIGLSPITEIIGYQLRNWKL